MQLRTVKRRIGVLAAATLASFMLGSISGPASPASAAPAQSEPAVVNAPAAAANLDNTWSCNVPANYVWDRTQRVLNTCGSGWAFRYRLRTPRNNLVSCTTRPGFTYDVVYNHLNVCNPGGFQFSYRLRTPQNGMWAYSVPAGWSHSSTQNMFNTCNPGGWAWSYRLTH